MDRIPFISKAASYVMSMVTFTISTIVGAVVPSGHVSASYGYASNGVSPTFSLSDIGILVSMAGVFLTMGINAAIQWYWRRQEFRLAEKVAQAKIAADEAAEAAERARLDKIEQDQDVRHG